MFDILFGGPSTCSSKKWWALSFQPREPLVSNGSTKITKVNYFSIYSLICIDLSGPTVVHLNILGVYNALYKHIEQKMK